MKKIYFPKFQMLLKAIVPLGFVLMFSLVVTNAFGQAQTLTWTGAVSNDASTPENWNPAMDYQNQIVKVDTATHYLVPPRFTAKRNDVIPNLLLSNKAEIFIAKPDTNTFTLSYANYYLGGIIHLESGRFNTASGKNFYLETTEANIIVSGSGYFNVQGLTLMGNKTATVGRGGHLTIKDSATYITRDIGRFQNDVSVSTITILDKGKFIVNKDYRTDIQKRIISGQIRSDEDHDVQMDFNMLTTQLILSARNNKVLAAYPSELVNVLAGEESVQLYALINKGFESMQNVQWKYTSTPGSGYKPFSPGVYGDTVKLYFPEPGMYYVVFQGTKPDNTIGTSNEVPVNVVATYSRIDLTGMQYLRPGQFGAKLTAVDQTAITSREWKYSKTQGSGYVSFSEPVTGTEYFPYFTENGLYYIICEYIKGGQTYITKEVAINVAAHNFTINWNGSLSDDANDIQNWTPMAHIQWMALNIPANSTVWPKLYGSKNDTVTSWSLNSSAKVYFEKAQTAVVNVRTSDTYLGGEFILNSGILDFTNTLRLTVPTDIVRINGNSEVIIRKWLIMGNASAPTSGGFIYMKDNARLTLTSSDANVNARFVTTSDSLSQIFITDNAKLVYFGNGFNFYSGLVETGDIFTEEGRRIAVFFNETDSTTTVYSVSETAFNVADKSDIVIGVKKTIKELSTKNTTGIVSSEWKYTSTPGSNYKSFVPKKTGATMTAAFDTAGTYYIICEGFDGINTIVSEQVKVTVVSVVINPADRQVLAVLAEGNRLTVKESVTADTREWKVSQKSGSEYTAVFPSVVDTSYTPLFFDDGIYYVVCESIVKGVSILSNEVKFVVGTTGIDGLAESSFNLFPNPARGAFYVNESSHSYTLSVVDMVGRVVLQRSFNDASGNQLIRFNGKGSYIVRLTTDDGVKTKVLVMQ